MLHACLMREVITRFGRHNLGVLWLVAEPMLFTLGVATLWYTARLNHSSDIPIIAFAITGYSSVLGWRNAAGRCSMAIAANQALLFHRNVRVIDVLLTRCLLELGGATGSFIVLTLVFANLEWMAWPSDPLKAVAGLAFARLVRTRARPVDGRGNGLLRDRRETLAPRCLSVIPAIGRRVHGRVAPESARKILLLLPMVHGVEMVRDGFFGHMVRTHYSVGYMCTVCMGMTLLALALTRAASRQLES